jgi:hypothetical protein
MGDFNVMAAAAALRARVVTACLVFYRMMLWWLWKQGRQPTMWFLIWKKNNMKLTTSEHCKLYSLFFQTRLQQNAFCAFVVVIV